MARPRKNLRERYREILMLRVEVAAAELERLVDTPALREGEA
jgi:hypothetical protein